MAVDASSSSNIAVNIVSVADEGDSLLLTVTYSSGPDTKPSWSIPFMSSEGYKELDYEVENAFANGEGRSSARITHGEAAKENRFISSKLLILRNQDCEVKVKFPSLATLRDLSPASHNFRGISLTLKRGNLVLEPGQDLFFRNRYRAGIRLDAVFSSPELSEFDIGLPTMWHSRMEREDIPGGIPVRKDSYGARDHDPINATRRMRGWKGRSTRKRVSFDLKNVEAVSGVLKVLVLRLSHRSIGGLVTSLGFKQNLYVLHRRGEEAIPNNTVAINTRRPSEYSEYDAPAYTKFPEMNLVAFGNPSPIVTLRGRRDCDWTAAGNSDDVEIVETRRQSKYEVNHLLRFKNASEALPGSYTVVARSGLMEVREIVSFGPNQ